MTEVVLKRFEMVRKPKPGVAMDFELISPEPAATLRDACLALFAAVLERWDFEMFHFEFGEMYALDTGHWFKTYPQDEADGPPDRTISVHSVVPPEERREALRQIPRILADKGVIDEWSKVDFVRKIDDGLAKLRDDS